MTRVAVEESSASGDPIATALLAAWQEIEDLKGRLSDRRTTISVEEYAERSGLGLSNLAKGIRTNQLPHIHVGDTGTVARVVVAALDDFFYQQAMGNIVAENTGRNVA